MLLALLLLAQGAPAPGPRDLAQAFAKRIADFEARWKAGQPPREKRSLVTDSELTAYLNTLVKLPPSVSGLNVRFDKERLEAKGILDLDQLQDKMPSGGMLSGFSFLTGRVNVSLRGRLTSDDGFGTFEPEEARVGSIPLAPSLVQQIVAATTKTAENPQGVDVLAPFRYPYGIRQIRLTPSRAVVEF
jgi:hypothetical protein